MEWDEFKEFTPNSLIKDEVWVGQGWEPSTNPIIQLLSNNSCIWKCQFRQFIASSLTFTDVEIEDISAVIGDWSNYNWEEVTIFPLENQEHNNFVVVILPHRHTTNTLCARIEVVEENRSRNLTAMC